jgi:hypothetical protein
VSNELTQFPSGVRDQKYQAQLRHSSASVETSPARVSEAIASSTVSISQSETDTGKLPANVADRGMIDEASASSIKAPIFTAEKPAEFFEAGTVAQVSMFFMLDYYCRRRASVRKQHETSPIRLISSQTRFEAPK